MATALLLFSMLPVSQALGRSEAEGLVDIAYEFVAESQRPGMAMQHVGIGEYPDTSAAHYQETPEQDQFALFLVRLHNRCV